MKKEFNIWCVLFTVYCVIGLMYLIHPPLIGIWVLFITPPALFFEGLALMFTLSTISAFVYFVQAFCQLWRVQK